MAKQDIINSLEFARKSLEIHGTIRASQLPRLRELLCADDSELEYRLKGGTSAQGRQALWLQVNGQVDLACQRCLEPMKFPVEINASFVIVPTEEALPAPEDEDDKVDYLVAEAEMQVWQLVEDEVLLGLPLAPMHENAHCVGTVATGASQNKENPFKILQGLKLNKN